MVRVHKQLLSEPELLMRRLSGQDVPIMDYIRGHPVVQLLDGARRLWQALKILRAEPGRALGIEESARCFFNAAEDAERKLDGCKTPADHKKMLECRTSSCKMLAFSLKELGSELRLLNRKAAEGYITGELRTDDRFEGKVFSKGSRLWVVALPVHPLMFGMPLAQESMILDKSVPEGDPKEFVMRRAERCFEFANELEKEVKGNARPV